MEAYEGSVAKRKGVKKMHDVWVARLTDVEWYEVDKETVDKMCDELEKFWRKLMDELLKERG